MARDELPGPGRTPGHRWPRGAGPSRPSSALEPERALTELRELAGIGPFAAELVLIRGALHPDVLPTHEGRLHQETARAYELVDPAPEQVERIADRWRPYRSLLLRARREDETGEISGRKPAARIEPASS